MPYISQTCLGAHTHILTRLNQSNPVVVSGLLLIINLILNFYLDQLPDGWKEFFFGLLKPKKRHAQDISHYLTKMRIRLIKRSLNQQLGTYLLTPIPFLNLLKLHSTTRMPFTMSDLDDNDKMNVSAAERLCSIETEKELEKFPETFGLRLYLRMMRLPLEVFSFNSLTDIERIEKMWYVVFIARAWQKHSKSKEFISNPTYIGIELNAHSLLTLHQYCKSLDRPDLFIPAAIKS